MIDRVLSAVPLGPLGAECVEWTAAVIQFALGLRDRLLDHPAVAGLMMAAQRPSMSPRPCSTAMTAT
ncbi:hypothetical protein ACFXK0_24225 [Nocardia sp. NPDC059177]|uniref:hypothetical protein n=1 Tax=Nocardia sp. NPDC059177 TaxID=3346759 RepID=UPI0036BD08CD